MTIRDVGIPVLIQKDLLFPDMENFYFLETTDKEGEFDLYFTHQNANDESKNFIKLIARFYQYETAKIVMNTLNKRIRNTK